MAKLIGRNKLNSDPPNSFDIDIPETAQSGQQVRWSICILPTVKNHTRKIIFVDYRGEIISLESNINTIDNSIQVEIILHEGISLAGSNPQTLNLNSNNMEFTWSANFLNSGKRVITVVFRYINQYGTFKIIEKPITIRVREKVLFLNNIPKSINVLITVVTFLVLIQKFFSNLLNSSKLFVFVSKIISFISN